MNRNVLVAVTALVLLGGFAFAARSYRTEHAESTIAMSKEQAERFMPAHAQRYGDPAAKVVIVEFFDPACETCATFAPIAKDMVDKNSGRVQLVQRYAPFHPGSDKVVAILEASRKQDKYWETLDLLFANQSRWTANHAAVVDQVWPILERGGLDVARLRTDAADLAIASLVQQDLADAKALGVTQTPEFFVNGAPLDPFGVDPLIALVQREYEKVYR